MSFFTLLAPGLQAQTPPTISNVSNQNINEDTNTDALTFTISDAETVATQLSMSGTSSNTTLVPNENIVFSFIGNSGTTRAVTVIPVVNLSGSSTITLTVSDGSMTTSISFVLSVNAMNHAPSFVSPAGPNWTARDSNRDWFGITSSADGSKLAATVLGGQIYTSTDSGVNWTARESNRDWLYITSSSDGTKLAALVDFGRIYTSSDSGVNWVARDSNRQWFSITSSADGTKLAAGEFGGQLYTSTDSGVNWVARTTGANTKWVSIASSSDGVKLAVVGNGTHLNNGGIAQIYTSTDSGQTWVSRFTEPVQLLQSITSSADGSKLAAVARKGKIYTSSDSGANWTARDSNRDWVRITSSADGSKLAAAVYGGQLYTSSDSGVTWVAAESHRDWVSITSSADGGKLAATVYGGQLYTFAGINYSISLCACSGPVSIPNFATSITPGPAGESSQTVSFNVTNDNSALFTTQPAIDANGTLTFALDCTADSAITVTVSAVDNGGTTNGGIDTSASQSFTITNPLADWRTLNFGNSTNSGNAADMADPDFDGVVNFVEYAFGLNPNSGSSLQAPPAVLSGGNLEFTFTQPPGVSCITYSAEWSTDLIQWYSISDTGSGGNHIFSVPVGTNSKMFMRHLISNP